MIAFYLNNKNEQLAVEDFGEGTVTEAMLLPRKVVESALKYNATSVILAHNHPGGLLEPSENDIRITKEILQALKTINITLQEHIIINENDYYSFKNNSLLELEVCS